VVSGMTKHSKGTTRGIRTLALQVERADQTYDISQSKYVAGP